MFFHFFQNDPAISQIILDEETLAAQQVSYWQKNDRKKDHKYILIGMIMFRSRQTREGSAHLQLETKQLVDWTTMTMRMKEVRKNDLGSRIKILIY